MSRRQPRPVRRKESGSVTIIVAALLSALFAMAALGVDAGFFYQTSRNLQAAADAAVMAGLPSLGTSSGLTTAVSKAQSMATTGSGYASADVTATTATVGTKRRLTVKITATVPFFFGKVFHYSTRTLTATAVGESGVTNPAVFAKGTTCPPAATGVQFNGDGFHITGDVQSNSAVRFYTGGGSNQVNGAVTYNGTACTGTNGYQNDMHVSMTSLSTAGGSLPSPFTYTTADFTCVWHVGNLALDATASGTYCATGDISLSGNSINATVTLVANGNIAISSSTAHLTASQNGLIAFSTNSGNCTGPLPQAISTGNSSVVFDGGFYAPNGCVNASGTSMTFNGSLVGNEVQIGAGGNSTINATGSGSSGYDLYQ
ncbi:MAG TPA: pilus assembly protein TadG-related protein [Polyangia bacterium]|nr:pilus assembly protein TadG-related protein [Polyangia bacterium]